MTVLLWKAWREQWLTMALAVAVVLGVAAWVWLSRDPHYLSTVSAGEFCAVAAGVLLGVAAGHGQHRELAYLRTSPVTLCSVWFAGAMLGLTMAALIGLVTQSVFDSLARDLKTRRLTPGTGAALCMLFFTTTHYFACWTRSAISAKALGLLLGGCFVVLAAEGGGPGVSKLLWQAVLVTGGIALLWLGRGRFLRAARNGGDMTRCETMAALMLPLLLLAALPLVAGVAALAVQLSRQGWTASS